MRILRFIFVSCLLAPVLLTAQDRPNILWIVCEDISPTLSVYGDTTAHTPVLDELAAHSMIYRQAFAPVGVCAPARSGIITGMYPVSIGTMHMRTGKDVTSWGQRKYAPRVATTDLKGDSLREYSAVIPENVKCFTEYLRQNGYFCTNNQKTDYQFAAPVTAWDQNDRKAHWRNRNPNQPFFAVFNINTTHESQLWENERLPLTVAPEKVPVPPYLPDNAATRHTIARHYSNVEIMDGEVGEILNQLKADGLYDQTIIFFYSDHGGPLPHQKREADDSGLRAPLMIKPPGKEVTSRYEDRLVSFIDLGPTVLSLAGIHPPDYMEGRAFMGDFEAPPHPYIFGSADRFDEFSDRIRMVRDSGFLYVRNYFPELPKYKDVAYRKKIPMMLPMLELEKQGQLNAVQHSWFETKTAEELYFIPTDPFCLNNLAGKPEWAMPLIRLRTIENNRREQGTDLGFIPESVLIEQMWPGGKQPQTAQPRISRENKTFVLSCPTPGASLAFLISDQPDLKFRPDAGWQLYTKPLRPQKGKYLYAVAERIGFQTSLLLIEKME